MRWLITGSGGRLGQAVIARLAADDTGLTGAEDDVIMPLDRASLDVTDPAAVREAVSDFRPDVVVNTAAYSAGEPGAALSDDAPLVGGIAPDADEQPAYLVNAVGPAVLASAVAAIGGRLVHVSSELVFAGDVTAPYPVDAPTAPRSGYRRAELAGESAVRELLPNDGYVVRTSWLYGRAGDLVVDAMLLAAGTSAPGESDADVARCGSPTWVADLADGLIALARSDAPAGIYQCTNSGQTTRLGFVRAVREELGAEPDLDPSTTAAPSTTWPAVHSSLSGQEWAAAGLPPMPHWRDALHRAFVTHGESLPTR